MAQHHLQMLHLYSGEKQEREVSAVRRKSGVIILLTSSASSFGPEHESAILQKRTQYALLGGREGDLVA